MTRREGAAPWLTRERWRTVARFLGPEVVASLTLGVTIGVILFAVELAFAYALQSFLVAIGVMQRTTVRLPGWVPQSGLWPVLAFIVTVGVLRAGLNAAQIYLQGSSHEQLRHRQRAAILRWTFSGESASFAEVTTLFNERTESAGQFVGNVQVLAIQSTSALLLACCMLVMAPRVTLAAAAVAALGLVILPSLMTDRQVMKAGAGLATEINKTNARLMRSIKNLLLLQIYGTLAEEERRTQESLDAYRGHILGAYRRQAFKYALPQVFGVVLICVITLASRSSAGLAPGTLVSYFYLLMRSLLIFSVMNQSVSILLLTWPNLRLLLDWWDARLAEELALRPAAADAVLVRPSAVPIGWRFDAVSFAYPGAPRPVLDKLSLTVEPGRTLVIVGPSGAGKSTLLNMMLGGLKPSSGVVELLFEGAAKCPLEERRAELLRSIGYVGPEPFLIEGTIRANLTYGLSSVPSAAEFDEALRLAECGFVSSLSNGLEHPISEQGQGLSAGQKQRLSLARALLHRPKVLILDEATSNLDLQTEERLVETLARLKGAMTIVAVTHRDTLMRIADQRLNLGSDDAAPVPAGS